MKSPGLETGTSQRIGLEHARRFGIRPDADQSDIAAMAFVGGEDQLLHKLVPALKAGSPLDLKAAKI